MILIRTMTQQDIERLLTESNEIARDWDTYEKFQQNRSAILQEFFPNEGLN